MQPLYIVLIGIGLLAFIYIISYNGLVQARQKVKEAWSGITVQLKRRYDLIPNLVNAVKGYATHEKEVFEKVTKARTAAMAVPDENIGDKIKAENMLSGTLKSIFALAENYPDLKANQNFLQMQSQLTETEDQIAAARRIYNGNVTVLNTKVEGFPSNIIASIHNFNKEEFFELSSAEAKAVEQAPEVKF